MKNLAERIRKADEEARVWAENNPEEAAAMESKFWERHQRMVDERKKEIADDCIFKYKSWHQFMKEPSEFLLVDRRYKRDTIPDGWIDPSDCDPRGKKMGRATVVVSAGLFAAISPRAGMLIDIQSNDIPADARFIATHYNPYEDRFYVTLESPSLPEVQEGSVLPRLNGPVFRASDAPLVPAEWAALRTQEYQPEREARMNRYRELLAKGRLTVNEIRAIEGLEGIGEMGDKFYAPANADEIPEPVIVEKKS